MLLTKCLWGGFYTPSTRSDMSLGTFKSNVISSKGVCFSYSPLTDPKKDPKQSINICFPYLNLSTRTACCLVLEANEISIFAKLWSNICQVYHADLSGSLGKLNLSLNRSAWALGLAWLTVACVSGYGGPVDWVDTCQH